MVKRPKPLPFLAGNKTRLIDNEHTMPPCKEANPPPAPRKKTAKKTKEKEF